MSRIEKVLYERMSKGEKAFIPFITAGDPHLEATKAFIDILAEEGADVIELGIPFSDPIADGPVIERANLRAMKYDMDCDKVFKLVKSVREYSHVPLVFLIYANMIYHYGIEAFFKACYEAGVDGVIVPDIPFEEKEEFDCYARVYGVDFIALVAPTSRKRIGVIVKEAKGFLYCITSLGVTGVRENIQTNLMEIVGEIRKYTKTPTAIGFGIATPDQVRALKGCADGIIVGSAIVKIIEAYGEEAGVPLRKYIQQMVGALRA